MRLVQATRFGGPDVLEAIEAPDPVAGPGEVVIGVSVPDVLFVDTQIRRGLHRKYFMVEPPYVPGAGVAGEVVSIGAGVDPGWLGGRVAAAPERGGYAEQAVASLKALIPVPDRLGLREAAALLHDGRTAIGLVESARIRPQEWVLVVAACGGLGILLVQLARAAGAQVIGAARGQRKLDVAREFGAEAVVDYTQPAWTELVREATGGPGPDVVFDGVGGQIGQAAFAITAHGGRFSAHGAPSGGFAEIDAQEAKRRAVTVRGIQHVQFAPAEGRRLTERALSEAAAGRIRPLIGQTFSLERAAEAHAAIEARAVIGKSLLLT
jgi:NADPH2:quinone reductase